MNMRRRRRPFSGISLVECMVAMAVAAVLLSVAVPGMTAYKRNAQLTATANRLLAAVNATRGEAMKRGATAMLVPAGGGADWNAGWVVFIDTDGKQALRPDGKGVVVSAGPIPDHLRLSGNGIASGSTPYVMFNPSGYSRTKGGAFGALAFTLVRMDQEGSAPEQLRKIMISNVGRARVCRPAHVNDQDCSDGNVW